MSFICKFCDSNFKIEYNLKLHQKRAKYCLKIQEENNILTNNDFKKCSFCEFVTVPHQIKRHESTCKHKGEKIILNYEEENELLKKNIYEYKEEIELLKQNIINKDIEIASLKSKIEIYEDDHNTVKDIAKQPRYIKNTNKIVFKTPFDFDIDKTKEMIDNNFTENYIFNGQKGIAKFTVDNLLKDDNGDLKYVCTDPSRQIFKYKDSDGDIKKDIEAKKLTNLLVDSGIREKTSDLSINWWTNDTGEIDSDKCNMLLPKSQSMHEIKDDNSVFKKELIKMTSI
jgi:hypothetical protein